MSTRTHRRVALTGLFAFGLLAACSDSTGPEFTADNAEEVAASLEGVSATVEAPDDALQSLALAGQALQLGVGFDVAAAIPTDFELSPAALRDIGAIRPTTLLPANYLGVTLVYHEGEEWYIPSDRTGAPENGVRIIYYAMDPVLEKPVSPLQELGYIDLTDEGTAASERLGIAIVSTSGDSDVTLADYYVDFAWEETQTSFTVNVAALGFVSDGTNQLDFDLNQSLMATEGGDLSMTMDHTLSVAQEDVSVNLTASAGFNLTTEEIADMEATFIIEHGANRVVLEATVSFGETETIEGTITFNGDLVANISGDAENPTITKPDGTELTEAEVAALRRIFDGVTDVFDFVEDIFDF